MFKLTKWTLMFMSFLLITVFVTGTVPAQQNGDIPSPEREFRGAWVATVANIDWPSKPGLSGEEQQQEALAILDKAVEINLNAIVFQVRPRRTHFTNRIWNHGRIICPALKGKPLSYI